MADYEEISQAVSSGLTELSPEMLKKFVDDQILYLGRGAEYLETDTLQKIKSSALTGLSQKMFKKFDDGQVLYLGRGKGWKALANSEENSQAASSALTGLSLEIIKKLDHGQILYLGRGAEWMVMANCEEITQAISSALTGLSPEMCELDNGQMLYLGRGKGWKVLASSEENSQAISSALTALSLEIIKKLVDGQLLYLDEQNQQTDTLGNINQRITSALTGFSAEKLKTLVNGEFLYLRKGAEWEEMGSCKKISEAVSSALTKLSPDTFNKLVDGQILYLHKGAHCQAMASLEEINKAVSSALTGRSPEKLKKLVDGQFLYLRKGAEWEEIGSCEKISEAISSALTELSPETFKKLIDGQILYLHKGAKCQETASSEKISQGLSSALTGLSPKKLKKLLDGLVSAGVNTKSDLQFVTEKDLKDHLKPIQRCKLLDAWKHEDLHDAWAGKKAHVILSKIGRHKLFYWDIAGTAPKQELESEVINAYLTVVVSEYNKNNQDRAALIDCLEMSKIWNGKMSGLKIDPKQYKLIVGIVHEHHHWMLTVMYPKDEKCLFLDPIGESEANMKKCLETTRSFMQKKGCNVSSWACSTLSHERQQDNTSCGVLAVKFAECILKGEDINVQTTEKAVERMRWDIAMTVLRKSDDLSNLCHYCGECMEKHENTNLVLAASKVNGQEQYGICCDICQRWYHPNCVQKPPLDKHYLCPACK